jgi:hypothetical protein
LTDQLDFMSRFFISHALQHDGDEPITFGGGDILPPHLGGSRPFLFSAANASSASVCGPPQIVWDIEVILWHR